MCREGADPAHAGQHDHVKRPAVVPTALLPFSLIPPPLVDRLPQRWWALGNIYWLRPTWISVHFCAGITHEGVRTVEVGRRTVAWGKAPFDYEASQRDAQWFEQRFRRRHDLTDDDE